MSAMKWETFYDAMQSADSADQLFGIVKNYAHDLGFEYVSYVMSIPSLNGSLKWVRFGAFPDGWEQRYLAQNYAEIDPLLRRGVNSIDPLIWSQNFFASAPQIWADAVKYGLKVGISQPCWAAQGVFGLLSFVRSGPALTPGEISMLRRQLQMVTNLLHLSMYERVDVPAISCIGDVSLTLREREILRWTSEGKTAEIIGTILNISTRTVNFHISNVLTKLVAVNKVQAVAKARTFGLL
ncbi:transcriptional activator [Brucella melitensis bv. 2 str. 63/9]|uniref:HTH-type quorum sensing-dependent transcriptional regulator VjbR n=2 Tax=Brucella melitensis TaxID=29459 RepID=C0RGP2_BRUMB|nr:Transcriptional activator protein solR [Brucella melitensis ATCC 23457]EEZ18845.1 transcriptional activator [Brucella melitensis bv. 2 str. 63/9]EXU84828.1 LuxR family transcriptional regulator [Brucella melitensis 548]